MIEASCHCGAVRFVVESGPETVTDCNCSICRRYGTLWAYYQRSQVRFAPEDGPTDVYMWGDRDLGFHRCQACGCVTHWTSVDPDHQRMGINARLMPSEVLAALPVHRFDGAAM